MNPTVNFKFPSSNEYGIPDLRMDFQGKYPVNPILLWGSKSRKSQYRGTGFFYVDDYRFSALWKNPHQVVETGLVCVSEVNYTISLDTPKAFALALTYQKRWLARYWQENGIYIMVDVNTPTEFMDINFLGVPYGWESYCTHGYSDRLEATLLEWEACKAHAGHNDIYFTVYGGGKKVIEYCQKYNWVHVPEERDRKKGKYSDNWVISDSIPQNSKSNIIQSVSLKS